MAAMSLGSIRAWPRAAAPPSTTDMASSSSPASAFFRGSAAPTDGRAGAVVRSSRRQNGARRRSFVGCRAAFAGDSGGLTPELKQALDSFVGANKVVLFMKGNRNFPQCGFSNTCIQILNQCQVPYETVNILEDESLRQGVKAYSRWPTYPQLYIDGEFFGGCDITLESFMSGELKEALDKALVS